ncbi:hypothetical protein T484DRAFT_1875280 [Baffinella frigidus]|nr:hypothetical protein T484DRAFT_1875280 [Cryptophyta sp. CCMP2293]
MTPLLPPNTPKVGVELSRGLQCIEWVFSRWKSTEVGKMRTELLEGAKGEDVVDMEDLIDYSVNQFTDREAGSAQRMKEREDASAPRRLLLLYSALSARAGTINAQAFHRLAAEFSLAEFRPGPLRGEARLSAEQLTPAHAKSY